MPQFLSSLIFGGDTNLYRGAAKQLKTDHSLTIASNDSTLTSLTLTGTQPASVAGTGTNASPLFSMTAAKGGNTTGVTGQKAGTGGSITLQAGDGGDAPTGGVQGNGANIYLIPGSPGLLNGVVQSSGNGYVSIGSSSSASQTLAWGNDGSAAIWWGGSGTLKTAATWNFQAPVTLIGTQPAAVAGAGTNAASLLSITAPKGGNTTGTTGQLAGSGSSITIKAGDGGDAPTGSTQGTGGEIILAPGNPGLLNGVSQSSGKGYVTIGDGTTSSVLAFGNDGSATIYRESSARLASWASWRFYGQVIENPTTPTRSGAVISTDASQGNTFRITLAGPSDLTDAFTTDDRASYTYYQGASTNWTVSGGVLTANGTSTQGMRLDAGPYADCEVTLKVHTGTTVAGNEVGLHAHWLDSTNGVMLDMQTSTGFRFYKRDAGTWTQLGSSIPISPALTAATDYWLRFRIQGNTLTGEVWNTAAPPSGTLQQTMNYTLTGADAVKFGAGIVGYSGFETDAFTAGWQLDDLLLHALPSNILATPTNPMDGQKILWELQQPAGGANPLYLAPGGFAFGTDLTAVNLSSAPNARDYLGAIFNSSMGKWLVLSLVRGF